MYRFSVLNRLEITNPDNYKTASQVPYIVISITSNDKEFAVLPECTQRLDCLQLKFDDVSYKVIDDPNDDIHPITPDQAAKILDFVYQYKDKIKDIVLHCDAGMSRSPGVALALNKVLNGTTASSSHVVSILGLSHANLLVRDVILNAYRDLYQFKV